MGPKWNINEQGPSRRDPDNLSAVATAHPACVFTLPDLGPFHRRFRDIPPARGIASALFPHPYRSSLKERCVFCREWRPRRSLTSFSYFFPCTITLYPFSHASFKTADKLIGVPSRNPNLSASQLQQPDFAEAPAGQSQEPDNRTRHQACLNYAPVLPSYNIPLHIPGILPRNVCNNQVLLNRFHIPPHRHCISRNMSDKEVKQTLLRHSSAWQLRCRQWRIPASARYNARASRYYFLSGIQ